MPKQRISFNQFPDKAGTADQSHFETLASVY